MFTVIISTHKRPQLVLRSLESVTTQTYPNWRAIIVIDDTATDYSDLKKKVVGDARITLLQNTTNIGKNQSVNRALDLLQAQAYDGHIIFLDDDDWLASNCLMDFNNHTKDQPWLVSMRFNATTNQSLTVKKIKHDHIKYCRDMLLLRRFSGETTHCLYFPPIKAARFPTNIKNAEEWLYFATIAKIIPVFKFLPIASTLSEGYLSDGLSVLQKNRREKRTILRTVFKEAWQRKYTSPYIYVYLFGRMLKTLLT